ncbi:hypothetical protein J6590_005867 [Homalodisca vitripennis]|nr:hypothetical protein J6590_005867 [Homalodisca vitripennis]
MAHKQSVTGKKRLASPTHNRAKCNNLGEMLYPQSYEQPIISTYCICDGWQRATASQIILANVIEAVLFCRVPQPPPRRATATATATLLLSRLTAAVNYTATVHLHFTQESRVIRSLLLGHHGQSGSSGRRRFRKSARSKCLSLVKGIGSAAAAVRAEGERVTSERERIVGTSVAARAAVTIPAALP